jgi:hypothetical protein
MDQFIYESTGAAMSTDQFEVGSIKFTKTGYRQSLKTLKVIYNNRQDLLYGFADALHVRLKQLPKAEQNAQSVHNILRRHDRGHYISAMAEIPGLPTTVARQYVTEADTWGMCSELFRGKGRALCKPRRSAFAHAKPSEKNLFFNYTDAMITMSEESISLEWEVPEGNHGTDAAWGHPVTKLFMEEYLGSKYNWKRGEGGIIRCYSDCHDGDGVVFSCERGFGKDAPKSRPAYSGGRPHGGPGFAVLPNRGF